MDMLAIYFVQTILIEVPASRHDAAWEHFCTRVGDFYREAARQSSLGASPVSLIDPGHILGAVQ
jgi:hypothetical protein